MIPAVGEKVDIKGPRDWMPGEVVWCDKTQFVAVILASQAAVPFSGDECKEGGIWRWSLPEVGESVEVLIWDDAAEINRWRRATVDSVGTDGFIATVPTCERVGRARGEYGAHWRRPPRTWDSTAELKSRGIGSMILEDLRRKSARTQWDLMPWRELESVARVITFGAAKHSPNGWQEEDPESHFAAAMRHISQRRTGQKTDSETGEPVLAHAVCRLLFMMWADNQRSEKP